MKKRNLGLTLIAILLAVITMVTAGCSKTLPPADGGESMETKAAVDNVYKLLTADLSDGFETAGKYSLAFKFDYLKGGKSTYDVKISVNKAVPEETKMSIFGTSDGIVFRTIYYSNMKLYVDAVNSERAVIYQINLNEVLETLIEDLQNQDAFTLKLSGALLSLSKDKQEDGYTFSEVAMGGLIDRFYDVVVNAFGSASVLAEILGMVSPIYSNDLKAMEKQEVIVLQNSVGNVKTLNEITYKGEMKNGENSLPFSLRLYEINMEVGVFNDIALPSDLDQYVEYSKATIAVAGDIKLKYPGRSVSDITGAFGANKIEIPAFEAMAKYAFTLTFDTENDGISKLVARIDLPLSIFEGIINFPAGKGPYIEFIYFASEKKAYIDATSFGLEKLSIDFTTSDFDDLFIIKGEGGTIVVSSIYTAMMENLRSESDTGVVIELNEAAIVKLLESMNVEDLFDFEKINISFKVANDGITNFKFRLDGPKNGANENYLEATSSAIKLQLHSVTNTIEGKDEYTQYEDIKNIGIATSGKISIPKASIDGSSAVNQLISDLTAGKVKTNFFWFKNSINYSVAANLDRLNSEDISIFIKLTSDPAATDLSGSREGVLIGYNHIKKTINIFMKEDGSGIFKEPMELAEYSDGMPVSELTGKGKEFQKIMDSFAALLKDEKNFANKKINLTKFLILNSGLGGVSDTVLNYIGLMLNGTSGQNISKISYAPFNKMTASFTFANNAVVTAVPSRMEVFYEKIIATTTSSVGTTYNIFGTNTPIGDARVMFATESGKSYDKSEIIIKPKFVDVKYDAVGSKEGYLVMSVAGLRCDVRAKVLGSKEVTAVIFSFGGVPFPSDSISIAVNSLSSPDYDLAAELKSKLSSAQVILKSGVTVANISVTFDKDIFALLSEVHSASEISVPYHIKNNLGEILQRQLKINITDMSNFAEVTNPMLEHDFDAYGGIDPRKVENYFKYYNINERKLTNDFAPSNCFILEWDLTNIIEKYKEKNWLAYKETTDLSVNVKAKNILGYEKAFNNINVSIYRNDVKANDISFNATGFGKGLKYIDNVEKTLYINPWMNPILKESSLLGVQFATTKLLNGQSRDIKIVWSAANGIVQIFDNANNAVDINNSGLSSGYIWYLFGDNIGGYQYMKLKVVVEKREITSWSLENPTMSGDEELLTKEIIDVNPLSFRNDMNRQLKDGIKYAKISTNLLSVVKFTTDAANKVYAQATNDGKIYELNVDVARSKVTINELNSGGVATDFNLSDSNFVFAGKNFNAIVAELKVIMKEWAEYRYTSFNFPDGIESLEVSNVNGILTFQKASLKCNAQIGSQTCEIDVKFIDKTINKADIFNTLVPGFDTAEVSVKNEGNKLRLDFDPYAKFDFTKLTSFPTKLKEIGTDTVYDIIWDISELTKALSMGKDVFAGRSNIIIKMRIDRGENAINGESIDYFVEYDVYVNIKAANIKEIDGNKVGHAQQETDSLANCDMNKFSDHGIMKFQILTINGSAITVNNPIEIKNYAKYIAVGFKDESNGLYGKVPDRWLSVRNWDISAVKSLYEGKFINEVVPSANLYVYAEVGNEYGGYQKVRFNLVIDDQTKNLKIEQFGSVPQKIDGGNLAIDTVAIQAGEGYAIPKLTFNPYFVSALDTAMYPKNAKLKINDIISTEYSVTKWEIPTGKTSDFKGSAFTVKVVISDAFRLDVQVVVTAMQISSLEGPVSTYVIPFNPLSEVDKDILGGGAPTVTWKIDGTHIVYQNSDDAYRFLFNNLDSNYARKLSLRINMLDLPRNNQFGAIMNEVTVGNDIGGYQVIKNPVVQFSVVGAIEVKQIYAVDEFADKKAVCARIETTIGGTSKISYDFDTLPLFTGRPNPEPTSLFISFRSGVKGNETVYFEDVTNIPNKEIGQVLPDGTSHSGAIFTSGLYYSWVDKNGNITEKNPYSISVSNRMKPFGFDFQFTKSNDIVVSQNIRDWFTFIDDANIDKNFLTFQWLEKYTADKSIAELILNILTGNDLVIDSIIREKFTDFSNEIRISANTLKFIDSKGNIVDKIIAPGKYTAIFSINAKEFEKSDPRYDPYYAYTTQEKSELKYYGSAHFDFTVTKKDLYDAKSLQYLRNGNVLSSTEGFSHISYLGTAYNFKVSIIRDIEEYKKYGLTTDCLKLLFTTDVNEDGTIKQNAVWKEFGTNLTDGKTQILEIGKYAVKTAVYKKGTTTAHELYAINQILLFQVDPFEIDTNTVTYRINEGYKTDGTTEYLINVMVKDEKGKQKELKSGNGYELRTMDNTKIDSKNIQLAFPDGGTQQIKMVFIGNYGGEITFTIDIPKFVIAP